MNTILSEISNLRKGTSVVIDYKKAIYTELNQLSSMEAGPSTVLILNLQSHNLQSR